MLVNGVAIEANIYLEMTYRELKDKEMIYYYFLVTGYIKAIEKIDENRYKLRISNKEIGYIYINYFKRHSCSLQNDNSSLFYKNFINCSTEYLFIRIQK